MVPVAKQRGSRPKSALHRGAGTTRSTSGWPPGSARPIACCRRRTPSTRRAATSSSGCSRPTDAPTRRPWPRACRSSRSGGSPTGAQTSRTWTCPPSCGASRSSCLVDELAHTNAPGLEHEKRYEDIEDLLDAGIDVLSTLNVQHLESLNDQVAELSGARVRETVPDSVLGRADEVVLIDLSPEALLTACGPARSTSPSASRPRSTASSASRTSRRCARSRCARWPRRSRPSAWSPRSSAPARTRWPPTCRRPSASACSPSSSPTRARSGWFAVPGARLSASAPSSTCSGSRRPGRAGRRAGAPARRVAPARLRPRRDADRRAGRRRPRHRRARRP